MTRDAPVVRFIGTWEALLLVHARRAVILREEDRPRIFSNRTPHSFNTFLVDGVVEGTWRYVDGAIELTPWRALTGPVATAARTRPPPLPASSPDRGTRQVDPPEVLPWIHGHSWP